MGRPRQVIPSYLKHSQTGRAIVIVRSSNGKRRTISLPGAYGSDESKEAYQRVLTTLRAHSGSYPVKRSSSTNLTIADLIERYLIEKVNVEYLGADGEPTTERTCIKRALKPLNRLYGHELADAFDAQALRTVRQAMLSGAWMNDDEREKHKRYGKPIGWCRNTANANVCRIRSFFKWSCLHKLVSASIVADLNCLPALKYGKGGREKEPVEPVAPELVEATLPHLPPVVRDMVQLQLLSGMRPGETCNLTAGQLDRSGPVWLYRLKTHKTRHHGHRRSVAIGPRAQLLLRKYITDEETAPLFSPAAQHEMIRATKRQNRKTPVQPSQKDRSKPNPKRKPKERFSVSAYARAIARACEKHNIEHWHPHRLRHTAALLVEREHGIEAARAVLGHRTVNMTAMYSGIDEKRAIEVARKMG